LTDLDLAGGDLNHVDLGELLAPIGRNVFEDEAELAVVIRRERGGAERLGIHVGVVGADKSERDGFELGRLSGVEAGSMKVDLPPESDVDSLICSPEKTRLAA
jgi:hypothetical protein